MENYNFNNVKSNNSNTSIKSNKSSSSNASLSSQVSTYSRFKDMKIESNSDANLGLQDEVLPEYRRESMVGKGSFGVAILYRRLTDDILVVLKQINLTELVESEREMAMNEVDVFSKLHHPNIICYYGSFIRDNTLIIEMEYAEGGTLAQIISERSPNNFFTEDKVFQIFEQMTSAINYMHSQNILHRDLKTANVFLNTKGTVKIGDFGISKIMHTKIHAQTVLGTPYYFSPEMCEGKEYDEKSDIWALGCILGEICCLKKAFAAANLSELVAKIMTAQFTPIPDFYSNDLKSLLRILIQVDTASRPTAAELLQYWIPLIYRNRSRRQFSFANGSQNSKSFSIEEKFENLVQTTSSFDNTLTDRSVVYQLKSFGSNTSLIPLQLPPLIKIAMLSTSGSHFITVSEDGFVHTWGEGYKGQLGHGIVTSWKHYPTKVDYLKKYQIIGACAGEGFSLFWSDTGVVLSCGDNGKGCLGHGNSATYLTPKVVDALEGIHITQIACGNQHVIALCKEGSIYSWGANNYGALGLPKKVIITRSPQLVDIEIELTVEIKEIYAGIDCSLILLDNGDVFACGKNTNNKLGFGKKVSHWYKFKYLSALTKKVVHLSVSTNCSAFVIEGGYVITMGNNDNGQRGLGHMKECVVPTLVTGIKDRYITKVQCYATYMVAISDDNIISLWGTRHGIPDASTTDSNSSMFNRSNAETFDSGNSTANFTNFLASVSKSEKILDPIDILAMYSSKEQLNKGRYIKLENVFPLQHSILVLVRTTATLVSHRQ